MATNSEANNLEVFGGLQLHLTPLEIILEGVSLLNVMDNCLRGIPVSPETR